MLQSNKSETTREIASARKAISEQERQLSSTAYALFKEKKFENCLLKLQKLSEVRPYDARIDANKAVVDYYISNFTKTDELSKQINVAKKQLEFGMVNMGDELDDIDRSFLLYNQAVLHFHMKQYKASINVLERLFKIIEPLGDTLTIKVCILLIESYLQNFQLDQAFGMISYVESMLINSKVNDQQDDKTNKELFDINRNKLHIFKVRLYAMKKSFQLCEQELEIVSAINSALPEIAFLKAHVSCINNNYKLALHQLNYASKPTNHLESGNSFSLMYYNNLSCIQYHMGKYTLAVLYARKALAENITVMKSLPPIVKNHPFTGRPLHTLAINQRSEIAYNIGLSLLFASKPHAAFDYFLEAQNVYQCNPRFWLRLGECCISVFQQIRNDFECTIGKKSLHVHGVIGNGYHRKVALSSLLNDIPQSRSEGQSAAMPLPTLEFANLCLTNALLLLPSKNDIQESMKATVEQKKNTEEQKDQIQRKMESLTIEASPGELLQTKEIYAIRGTILSCQTYVSLELGDYYKALDSSQELLQMAHLSSPLKFLGRIYYIQTLIRLDRISEAIKESSPDSLKYFHKFDDDILYFKTMKPFPKDFKEARSIMMLNWANVYCLHTEYEHCKRVLRQLISSDLSPSIRSHAILISVYCDLRMGNINSALNLIKRSEVYSPE